MCSIAQTYSYAHKFLDFIYKAFYCLLKIGLKCNSPYKLDRPDAYMIHLYELSIQVHILRSNAENHDRPKYKEAGMIHKTRSRPQQP